MTRRGAILNGGRWRGPGFALALAAAVGLVGADGPGPSVRLEPPGDPRGVIEVVGVDPGALAAAGPDALRVTTADGAGRPAGGRPPLLGSARVDGTILRFRPRFPLEPGVRYRASYQGPDRRAPPVVAEFVVPRPAKKSATATAVVRVAPGGGVVPANLLKFYVEFSGPMSRGQAYGRVRLLDEQGLPVDLPFLELGEELWDPRGTRLTLLFDPGRIKTGLRPRAEAGPVLEAGKGYTLVIDRGWPDAGGDPLAAEFRKPFRVGPADLIPPDPAAWVIDRPEAGTRSPVLVRFPEPMDRALLGRMLAVHGPGGAPLAGSGTVGDGETSWSFRPDQPWVPGAYSLAIGDDLEDLAGNGVGRPFEVDVFEKVGPADRAGRATLPFAVGGR